MLSQRLERLQRDMQSSPNDALDRFWEEIERQGAPVIEPGADGESLVTFVWRDDGVSSAVAVIQDWGADGIREHWMARLGGSDVWYLTRSMPSDTRTTYQFSPSRLFETGSPAPYLPDPLNPKTFAAYLSEGGDDIVFSLLELPDAPALPWRAADSPAQAGTVSLHTPFADRRRMWVYMPPGQGPPLPKAVLPPKAVALPQALPLLLAFDGRMYKDQLVLPAILDTLIASGSIPPAAALMVDNIDRTELLCRPDFAAYIAGTVIPWVRGNFPVTTDPAQTIILGSSYGGLAAAYLAFTHPSVFGVVLSQTGWFRWQPAEDVPHHWLARQIAAAPRLPLRFWLQVGRLESGRMLDGGPSQLEANRYMRDALLAKGYPLSYQEYSGGHDASSLEYPLARAVEDILGKMHRAPGSPTDSL